MEGPGFCSNDRPPSVASAVREAGQTKTENKFGAPPEPELRIKNWPVLHRSPCVRAPLWRRRADSSFLILILNLLPVAFRS
jgi:hypothetical protein